MKEKSEIISRLYDERVFSMEIVTGGVKFVDECDYCFELILTKEEFKQFIQECIEILNRIPQEAL